MDLERKKVFDITDRVREILENFKPRDGRGYVEDEIRFLVEKNIPNYDPELLKQQMENVEYVQVGAYAVAFRFEVEAVLYNMLYHA